VSAAVAVIRRVPRADKLGLTLDLIRQKIHAGSMDPRIRALAVQLIREARVVERDYWGELTAIARGIKARVRFTRDPHRVETIGDAADTLDLGAGDCDDYTVLCGACLKAVGFPVRLKLVGQDRFSHIFPEARVGGRWTPVDLARPSRWHGVKSYPLERTIELTERDTNMSGLPFQHDDDLGDLGGPRLSRLKTGLKTIFGRAPKVYGDPNAAAAIQQNALASTGITVVPEPIYRAISVGDKAAAKAASQALYGNDSLIETQGAGYAPLRDAFKRGTLAASPVTGAAPASAGGAAAAFDWSAFDESPVSLSPSGDFLPASTLPPAGSAKPGLLGSLSTGEKFVLGGLAIFALKQLKVL